MVEVTFYSGNARVGILSILILFIIGLLLLIKVDIEKAENALENSDFSSG